MSYEYNDKQGLLYVITKIHTLLTAGWNEAASGETYFAFNKTLKDKLDGIADNATKVLVDGALNGTSTNAIANKAVYDELVKKIDITGGTFTGAVTLPAVASSVNDNTAATTSYVTNAITTALGQISGISFDGPYTSYTDMVSKVTTPKTGVIYLVTNSGTAPNANDEYFWNAKTSSFELFGTTAVDLQGYVKNTDLVRIDETEIDTMFTAAGFTT